MALCTIPTIGAFRSAVCCSADLTQSWSDVGGGVGTYLRHKRRHILENTPHRIC